MKIRLVGVNRQTAAYVSRILLERDFKVTGSSRDKDRANLSHLSRVGVNPTRIHIVSQDPAAPRQFSGISAKCNSDVIINLPGQTSLGLSFDQPAISLDSISTSCLNFIEAIKARSLNTIYCNAASSECFGNADNTPASEDTPFRPYSSYTVATSLAFHLTRLAREAYKMLAFSGVQSYHQSPLRGRQFVTAKFIEWLRLIKSGSES